MALKSLSRVALPVVAVAGIIFVVTYLSVFSGGNSDEPEAPKDRPVKDADKLPLKFFTTAASHGPDSGWTVRLWDPTVERGLSGHFEFPFVNATDKAVTVSVPAVSCSACVTTELGVVPPDALRDFLAASAAAGFAGPTPGLLAGVAAAQQLAGRIAWQPLTNKEGRHSAAVPPADPAAPNLGLLRMSWLTKPEHPRNHFVTAAVVAQAEGGKPYQTELRADMLIVEGFHCTGPDGRDPDLDFPPLGPNDKRTRSAFCWSFTRTALAPTARFMSPYEDDPNVRAAFAEPTAAEMAALKKSLGKPPLCAYRLDVTAAERVAVEEGGKPAVRQMDLGPFSRTLRIDAGAAGTAGFKVGGVVEGDIRVTGASGDGKVDIGSGFPSNEERWTKVPALVVSDRPGLELALADPAEFHPKYLKAELKKVDGADEWKLRVGVKANAPFGSLPLDAVVVVTIRSKDAPVRRIRIPVKGNSFDASGRGHNPF